MTLSPVRDERGKEQRGHWPVVRAMIAIAITPAAYEAIEATLLGRANEPPRPGPDGLIKIWLDRKFVDRLGQKRGPSESYSDVILRLAETGL